MEEDLVRLEGKITKLEYQKEEHMNEKTVNIGAILGRLRYFLEHHDKLLTRQIDPVKKAQLFGAIFNKLPTFDDLNSGTQKTPLFTEVNSVFALVRAEKSHLVSLRRTY